MASSAAALAQDADSPLAIDGVLPTDVLYEVLLRVPAKALCRLRLVCRSWRSLTSHPRFATAHTARHPLLLALLLRHYDGIHVVDLSGNVVKCIRGGALGPSLCCMDLSSQAGLVCINDNARGQDLVLNPATGAVTVLPDGNRPVPVRVISCILGHVPSTGENKVLRMSYDPTDPEQGIFVTKCEVMTLGGRDQRWRTPKPKPGPLYISPQYGDIAAVHGVAYFRRFGNPLADDDDEDDDDDDEDSSMVPDITVLDLATEEWRPRTLQGPISGHLFQRGADHIQFSGLDGCLAIIHHKRRDCSTDVWFLMDVDNGLWTKRYSMRCAPHWKLHALSYPPCPLVVLDDGRVLAWIERQYALRVYDPSTGAWADLATVEDYCAIRMYQGSLLCSDIQG